jgi:large subunit ribosomal protein L15
MDLKDLKPSPGSTHRKRRVGRGIGSGHGKTAGRGHKGLGARSHGNTPPSYEGGQMPLQRRLPKQGFRRTLKNQARRDEFAIVNLSRLGDFGAGVTIDAAALAARGLIPAGRKVKVLGDGDLKSKIKVRADAFSKSALDKIAAAGGVAELVSPRFSTPPAARCSDGSICFPAARWSASRSSRSASCRTSRSPSSSTS